MNGLKMGPKHKGFPMTQSIHFYQERKKVFKMGLTPIRGPHHRINKTCTEKHRDR